MQPLSPANLAECLVDSLKNPKASRKMFDIGGPERLTYKEAITMVAHAMGQEPKISYSPVWMAIVLAYVINWIKPGGFMQPDWIEILTMDSIADVEPIQETFNIELDKIEPYLKKHLSQ
jgi:nucleoside-diphosphate-sugar epimerase